jgi:hypothetical protein
MTTSSPTVFTTMLQSGRNTYYVDVREAKNGNRYLAIVESRQDGEQRQRSQICVFGQSVDPFRRAVAEAASVIAA